MATLSVGKITTSKKSIAGLNFAGVYRADPQDRIVMVKQGVAPSMVETLADGMSTTAGSVLDILGLSRSTVARKKAEGGKPLSIQDSEKVLGLAKLVGQVEVIVQESGRAQGFDAGKWLNVWLNQPMGALDGKKPAQFMDTAEGQTLVSNLLGQIQHGVYA